jgi:NADPH:quinone reductase
MRALIVTSCPEALVALCEAERPRLRPDEALVQVDAFSVDRGEMFLLEDQGPGWRPGKDIAGLVVQAAADGTGPAVGQRVTGHAEDGGWAEYATAASSLAAIPESVSAIQAAALPLAGLTALRLLRCRERHRAAHPAHRCLRRSRP